MWTSTAWVESSYSSTTTAMEIVLEECIHILKVSETLVTVLRLVDSEDKPAIGNTYETMDKAKEVIQRRSKKKKNCREINKGLNDVIMRLAPNYDIQNFILKQCDAYKDCNYELGLQLKYAIVPRYLQVITSNF
ncbi:hypothetical protein CKAN_00514500 [Cinnamomum micranthum f. kanehirae]|uniref:Uncharacterized protein n=1 Tax=Cinnamomum micranthum f. kanehirae TaxID=337451 RepID=A0A443NDQ8_9MAGN|nr:hypothetical protein CKAN_00514500 [Cinnamomum micranthum f. kanehirae]